jgi:hypothetical protein
MFPIAAEAAERQGVPLMMISFLVMLAASASFMSPFGYQTNLMVYGPGGRVCQRIAHHDIQRMFQPAGDAAIAAAAVPTPIVSAVHVCHPASPATICSVFPIQRGLTPTVAAAV